MTVTNEARETASALRIGIGLVLRRLRQAQPDGGLSMPESTALVWLDREGPMTCSELAKHERITPQSMGATLAALETGGFIRRRADPDDGRRAVMSLTRAGRDVVLRRRDATTELIARALAAEFDAGERDVLRAAAPLLERLARAL